MLTLTYRFIPKVHLINDFRLIRRTVQPLQDLPGSLAEISRLLST